MASKSSQAFLLVGLGNYTHPLTRHSIGQVLLDSLLERINAHSPSGVRAAFRLDKDLGGWVARTEVVLGGTGKKRRVERDCRLNDGLYSSFHDPLRAQRNSNTGGGAGLASLEEAPTVPLILLKPRQLMNLNGRSVLSCSRALSIPPSRIVALHDELSSPFGKVWPKLKGSAGGHNGVKSMIASLRTDEFQRVRVGIGRPEGRISADVAAWVLSPLSRTEVDACAWDPQLELHRRGGSENLSGVGRGELLEKTWLAVEAIIAGSHSKR